MFVDRKYKLRSTMLVGRITILIVAASLTLLCGQTLAANAVSVSKIDGFDSTTGGLMANTPIRFYINYEVGDDTLKAMGNAYHLYSTDGAMWEPLFAQATIMTMNYFAIFLFIERGITGSDADTLDLLAVAGVPRIGLSPGFDSNLFFIETKFSEDQIGRTVCFDTTSEELNDGFKWITTGEPSYFSPDWSGGECFEIVDCCVGNRGDVNGDGVGPNIVDLVRLVDYIFRGFSAPDCKLESDVNGDGLPYNLLDLIFVIDWMHRGGPAAPACPN